MNKPLVSVVIPCYNHERYVENCIMSVIAQDYDNIELIVIDDGSTDGSVENITKLTKLCQDRFRRFEFRHRENKGLNKTLNEAIDWCEGVFLVPFASDDIMFDGRLRLQVSKFYEINSRDLVGVFSGVDIIGKDGDFISRKKGANKIYFFNDVFLRHAFLPAPTAMLLLESVRNAKGYDESIKIEDLYMWLKLSCQGGVFYSMSSVLVGYRDHDSNFTKDANLVWLEVKKILDEYKENPLYSRSLANSMMVQANNLVRYNPKQSVAWGCRGVLQFPCLSTVLMFGKVIFKNLKFFFSKNPILSK